MSLAELQQQITGLPIADRAALLELLWDSIDTEVKQHTGSPSNAAAWAAESEERINAIDRGEITTKDASETLANLRRLIP